MIDKNTEKAFGLYSRLKQEAGISGKVTPQNISKIRNFVSQVYFQNSRVEKTKKYMVNIVTIDSVFNLLIEPSPCQKKFLFALFKSDVKAKKPLTTTSIEKKVGIGIGSACPSSNILENMILIEKNGRKIVKINQNVFKNYWPEIENWKEIKSKKTNKGKETPNVVYKKRINQGKKIIKDELKIMGILLREADKTTIQKIIKNIRRSDFTKNEWKISSNSVPSFRKRLLKKFNEGKLFFD